MDVVGGFALADGTHAKALIGIDGHSRIVCARVMAAECTSAVWRQAWTRLASRPPTPRADGTTTSRREPWNHVRGASGILGVALLLVGRQVVIVYSSIMIGIRQDLPGSGGSFQQVKQGAPQHNTGGNPGR
jgi:hypothetical protein